MALSPPPNKRLLGAVGTGAVLVGSLAYVGLGNPHSTSFVFLPCPFKALTGWNCPACGGLRMTHDLLHGDLTAAVVDNVFLLVGLPMLLAWVLVRRSRGKPVSTTSAFVVIIATAVAWTVVRNIPGFPLIPTVLDG
ncbi:membrane protein [Mycolicibacterium cyprinidarum]|uniref:Membrane protein n=1 Tax=Mycolicibacterium cyprinidarum TaxID=2860311 RepID=A0ABQ4VAW1_9MYCO|nr:membrane protein [Mycolicibacterium sp. NGTWS0302]GJF14586.1 membrane protein [Mycolicibacterium sp. NGTWSNA01]GJF17957.1 membrane protein [Mycolicibacterium sp. NGTWS1803]